MVPYPATARSAISRTAARRQGDFQKAGDDSPGKRRQKQSLAACELACTVRWVREDLRFPVLLSVGPADEYLDDFARAMAGAGVRVVSGLSPLELAALLSRCRLYVGSDSGVSHLAAAVGIPTVAVFGPSDPVVWAPRGRSVRVLQRTWSESETLEWDNSDAAEFADEEMMEIIVRLVSQR